jgi:hypothetical protein
MHEDIGEVLLHGLALGDSFAVFVLGDPKIARRCFYLAVVGGVAVPNSATGNGWASAAGRVAQGSRRDWARPAEIL